MAGDLSHQSAPGFHDFTLGELTLLALGLWVIGEQDRVDHQLMPEYRGLQARLSVTLQTRVAEATSDG